MSQARAARNGRGLGLALQARRTRFSLSARACYQAKARVLTLAIRHGFVLVLEHVLTRGYANSRPTSTQARAQKVPHFVHECAEGKHEGTYYETSKILD